MKKYFEHTYGDIWMFFEPGEETSWNFVEEKMHEIASEFLERSRKGFPSELRTEWERLQNRGSQKIP